jgi:selenocysteine-specific elongation factor
MNGRSALEPGASTFAQIRLEKSLPLSWQDSFLVRLSSPVRVIGGGTVLACHPKRRTTLLPREEALLQALLCGEPGDIVEAIILEYSNPFTAAEIAFESGIESAQVHQILTALLHAKKIVLLDKQGVTYYALPRILDKRIAEMNNTLLVFHDKNPTALGMSKSALRQKCNKQASSACFNTLLAEAVHLGHVNLLDGQVCHPKAGSAVRKLEEEAATVLLQLLSQNAKQPPFIPDLIAESHLEGALAYRGLDILEKRGDVTRISTRLCFTYETFCALENVVKDYLAIHKTASVSELKDTLATSRKYAVPLLEYLDAKGITKRVGDERTLRS